VAQTLRAGRRRRDLQRSAAQRTQPTHRRARIVQATTQTLPEGATHRSTRTLAAELGVPDTTVLKVWHASGLKPHLTETFKVSRDPGSSRNSKTSWVCI